MVARQCCIHLIIRFLVYMSIYNSTFSWHTDQLICHILRLGVRIQDLIVDESTRFPLSLRSLRLLVPNNVQIVVFLIVTVICLFKSNARCTQYTGNIGQAPCACDPEATTRDAAKI